ncbi:MAG: (Fe-S)-binding protein, partial [Flavobacteriales bacterium]
IRELIETGKLRMSGDSPFKGRRITFHDPCYLGRSNGEYLAPREVIAKLDAELLEMRRCKQNAMCCGAGGAQMFKEAESGDREVNHARTDQALETQPEVIATGCPFCNTMMTDGVKNAEQESNVVVKDIAELIAEAADLLDAPTP